jgi:putative transposase
MLATYKFKSSYANISKIYSIKKLGLAYKFYYNKLILFVISEFYKNEGFVPRFLPCLEIGNLSIRYKQNCGKQVKTDLICKLSNIKNKVREKIIKSNLSDNTKMILHTINNHNMWFKKNIYIKCEPVPQELLKLARKIFHHCRGNYPRLKNITLSLNANVASVEKAKNSSFDYWIKLSTLNKSHPIYLPIKTYDYFESKTGILKKQIQIIVRENKIEYGFVKDIKFEPLKSIRGKTIGLDIGVVTPLNTSTGNQYGLGLYEKLKRFDKSITELIQMRMKNGFNKKSPRLCKLYDKTRNLLKNEIGRISNEFLKNEKPEEIILENNDKITEDLKNFSAGMRRLIKNSGITRLRDTLIKKGAKNKIKIIKINQAYTSQECPLCHCVSKKNRKSQKIFKCIRCGYTRNADYVASINIRNRRSITSIGIYTPHKLIRGLLEAYYKDMSRVIFQT